jgi:hypothetical protein
METDSSRKYLAAYEEFLDGNSETSSYEVPKWIVRPQKNDKIIYYMKGMVGSAPRLGHNFKKQEKRNQNIR